MESDGLQNDAYDIFIKIIRDAFFIVLRAKIKTKLAWN